MSKSKTKCIQCRRETFPHVIDAVSGEEGPLSVTLRGLRVQVCPRGHKQLTHGAFAARFVLGIAHSGETLPVATSRGFWSRRLVCTACSGEVDNHSDPLHTFHLDVQDEDAPMGGVDLSLPAYQCGSCGKAHLRSRKDLQALSAAVLNALRAAGAVTAGAEETAEAE